MINRILRLIHTLRYLKPGQLAFFILRRKFPPKPVSYEGVPRLSNGLSLLSPAPVEGTYIGEHRFCFLNVERDLGTDMIWSPSDVPRLWRYNLHYFDYLRDDACSKDHGLGLITSWIDRNPQGSEPGWEPFTASLRIVNWVFFLHRNPLAVNDKVLASLYEQVLWLEKNDERHILANHYFENLKALSFAGCFFEGADAQRWRRKGLLGVKEQLEEQTLSDSGHYERTPQYHALMLENYLDLLNLVRGSEGKQKELSEDSILGYCQRALVFYQQILFPDKKPPLFNDTAFGIAPSVQVLGEYFQRLSGVDGLTEILPQSVEYRDSGIFLYRSDDDMLVVDGGDVGPSYQPGHTHCDMLSYELMLGGHRIVVDTGVCEYSPGETRRALRSTRAHNTVSVNGAEQSEVWGEFRVARRAKMLNAQVSTDFGRWEFKGAYRGFHCVGRVVEHHRVIEVAHSPCINEISITDTVTGADGKLIESFIHLHPSVEIVTQSEHSLSLSVSPELSFSIEFPRTVTCALEESFYCPEFGVQQPNTRIVLKPTSVSECSLTYTIKRN